MGLGGFLRKVGRAIDPTTPRGLANLATGGMYELTQHTSPLVNPLAAGIGGQIDPAKPQVAGSTPGEGMVDRSKPGPGAVRPQFFAQAAPGYAMNPYQQAMADALRARGTGVAPVTPETPNGGPPQGYADAVTRAQNPMPNGAPPDGYLQAMIAALRGR